MGFLYYGFGSKDVHVPGIHLFTKYKKLSFAPGLTVVVINVANVSTDRKLAFFGFLKKELNSMEILREAEALSLSMFYQPKNSAGYKQ